MFGTIRKHSTWLWMLIIVVVIISFVIFFSPNVPIGGGSQQLYAPVINGKQYSNEQYLNALREVRIPYLRLYGQVPNQGNRLQYEALVRLLIGQRIKERGIQAGDDAAELWIRNRMMTDGKSFGGLSFDQFVQQMLEPSGITAEDFYRYALHEAEREILRNTIASAGELVTPLEARKVLQEQLAKMSVDVAYTDETNYTDQVVVTEPDLKQYYTNRLAVYRIPERIQVDYVLFSTTNYFTEAANELGAELEQRISDIYSLRGTNAYPSLTMEEAKEEIRKEVLRPEARRIARQKAYEFVNSYYDMEPKNPQAMALKAADLGLEVRTTEPFTRGEGPEGLPVGSDFAQKQFQLTPSEPFGAPVEGTSGFYVTAFNRKLPSDYQPFDEIRDEVEEDYRDLKLQELANEAMERFYSTATNAVAEGQDFAQLAELSGMKVARLEDVSLSTESAPEGVELPTGIGQIVEDASNLEAGEIRRPTFTPTGQMVIYLRERRPATEEEIQAQLEEQLETMREQRSSEMFSEWLNSEIINSGILQEFQSQTDS